VPAAERPTQLADPTLAPAGPPGDDTLLQGDTEPPSRWPVALGAGMGGLALGLLSVVAVVAVGAGAWAAWSLWFDLAP